ncbi:hypothetical protein HYDPIDRAFT_79276 [Hydnomerulius pinastri MD-312]|nr:hypothetical protein HYDPIDRAFT_79276 [Hydnomerulius pinastri MD-312]
MGKNVTKVVYQPNTQSTEEFIAIVDPVTYKKWKAGGTTIPLADVVDSFDVFVSTQGHQGLLGKPSRQQLDSVFGTHKDVDVVTILLQKGKEQTGEGFNSGSYNNTNAARGSISLDSRGKGLTGL